MRRGQKRIEIKTASDYNCICDDILNEYCESFTGIDGLTRFPDQDDIDSFGEEIGWIYTQKGMALYDRAVLRLKNLGLKYFDESELEIEASGMLFP
ncbi:hypothetical protein PL373_14455 [Tenacibaculum maritimum]|nr:hypothetical protein [Tenacibaculum maritimum]MDB0602320.1 hypothetical protein [Tenacibaculum maritimum]MDB0612456.1 hypothetical protein [Tenacibaculum maritimum]